MPLEAPYAPGPDDPVEDDELTALITAIRFAYHDWGINRVLREVHANGDRFARVSRKRVQRIMRAKGMVASGEAGGGAEAEAEAAAAAAAPAGEAAEGAEGAAPAAAEAPLPVPDGPIRLMTVGTDGGLPQPPAAAAGAGAAGGRRRKKNNNKKKNARQREPEPQAEPEPQPDDVEDVDEELDPAAWARVELDVAAMDNAPHQAVVSLQTSEAGAATLGGRLVLKIQLAALPGGLSSPMLVYDKARTRKTFLHPAADGFRAIAALILRDNAGSPPGVGLKAFFYARHRRGETFLHVDTRAVAPRQPW